MPRSAVVIAEQAAQSLTTSHLPVGTADALFRFEQRVPQPLMVALSMIMMFENRMSVFRVFLPFAAGYFLSHVFRSVNAIAAPNLIETMGLNAWMIGFLTSAFFFAFAVSQLPIGVALDRWGTRRTEAALLVVAAGDAFVFSRAASPTGLILGRALIGFGMAACLVASFKAFVVWAPSHRVPFLNGAVMAVGSAGALAATLPVEWALRFMDWRGLFLTLGVVTLGAAGLLFVTVPEKKVPSHVPDLGESLQGVKSILTSRVFWSIAPFSVAQEAAYLSIQSLWAGPWLRDVAGLDRVQVASVLMTMAMGMALGYLAFGRLGELCAKKGFSILPLLVVANLAFLVVQLGILSHWSAAARGLWLLFGFFGASGVLSFVILTRRFAVTLSGRVNTSLNLLICLAAFASQSGIGAIIERWSAGLEDGFAPAGYRAAFFTVLAVELISLLWLTATRRWRA